MFKKTLISLAVASSLGLTGCFDSAGSGSGNADPDYKISNPDFTGKTWPVLNGLSREFPIPNDILTLLNPVSDGTMIDGSDPTNPVTTGLGFLDGNSTTAAFDIELSGSIDPNQELDARSFVVVGENVLPNPDQNVFLLPLTFPGGDPLLQADGEIPSFKDAIDFQTGAALAAAEDPRGPAILSALAEPVARAEVISLDEGTNNYLRINPIKPLDPKTKYLVVITNKVEDASGEALVGSPAYQNYSDPDQPLGNNALAPFKDAVLTWETLADGYFGFMQTVYDQAGAPFSSPKKDDIVFTITFTTTGVEDVVTANAAPRKFFANSAIIDAKQEAITKLNTGAFNLTNQPISAEDPDSAINARIFTLLTDQSAEFQFFNADLATTLSDAEAAGIELTFADVAVDSEGEVNSTLAFALQSAAAQASLDTVVAAGPTTIEDVILTQTAQVEAGFVTSLGALESAAPRSTNFFDTGKPASTINPALAAPAMVSEGEIELPYFLGVPADSTNGQVIRTASWESNQNDSLQSPPEGSGLPSVVAPSDKITYRFPFIEKTTDLTVPTLATYPDETHPALVAAGITKPADGWPVIIYQHGITADRSAMLPMANALAFACVDTSGATPTASGLDCFATVAIDQPLHGVMPKGSTVPGLTPIKDADGSVKAGASAEATERHLNFTANQMLQATPISALPEEAAQSGSLFINLSNFANSRDNNRQGTLDLLNLNASISQMDIDGDANNGPDLDVSRVYFVGHSLGGINGIPFVSINNEIAGGGVNASLPEIQAAAILNSGGGITKLLENSPNTDFGAPAVLAGLAQASDGVLVQGSSALESYFSVLQGLLDSTDPVNYGNSLSGSNILLTEIVGDGTAENLPDQTIPNAADADLYDQGPLNLTLPNGFSINSLPAPLAGTEPMISQFGATPTADGGLPAVTRFTEGSHATPVSADNVEVFSEMVSQIAQLFTTGGITVTNPAIVESSN